MGSRSSTTEANGRIQAHFLTLAEVAIYLHVSEAQAYALVRSGELPGLKIGGRGVWRIDREKLEEFIERLTEETAGWVREHPLSRKEREPEAASRPEHPFLRESGCHRQS
jgi:excisionase family DNA binding protein